MFSVLPVNTPWDSLLMHENTPQGQRRAKERPRDSWSWPGRRSLNAHWLSSGYLSGLGKRVESNLILHRKKNSIWSTPDSILCWVILHKLIFLVFTKQWSNILII